MTSRSKGVGCWTWADLTRPLAALLLLLLAVLSTANHAHAQEPADARRPRTLKSGWYFWDPYQYEVYRNDQKFLTGLDIRLTEEIFSRAGYKLDFSYVEWGEHQQDIRTGNRDIAAGAFFTPQRAEFSHYSEPYRTEVNVLIMRRGESRKLQFANPSELLDRFRSGDYRLGRTEGYAYALPEINDFFNDPALRPRIIEVGSERENFQNLINGNIDAFFADRIVAQTVAWRNGWQRQVEEHPHFKAEANIYVIFSKASTSLQTVEEFNRSLEKMRADGTYSRIIREYLFPILLSITLEQHWFLGIDIIGTIAFALSGLFLARREDYSIMGACVLAALPAVGGGITRDLIVSREPLGVLRTPLYIMTILLTVVVGYVGFRLADWWNSRSPNKAPLVSDKRITAFVQVADALGLAAFTIIGVVVAVEARCSPLWIWGPLLAFLTGAGGGILRDVVRAQHQIPSLKGEFYPEVAIIWGLLLAFFLEWQTNRLNPDEVYYGVLATLAGAFLTRLAAIWFKWRSPMF
jgi:polar amino acid transport system substrate-binding protein